MATLCMGKTLTTAGSRNEIVLGVMGEKVSNIEKTLAKLEISLKELTDKIDNVFATKAELEEIRQDVGDLKDNNKWIIRLIMGIIVTAILALVIAPRLPL